MLTNYILISALCCFVLSFLGALVLGQDVKFKAFLVIFVVLAILAVLIGIVVLEGMVEREYNVTCYGEQFHVVRRNHNWVDYETGKGIYLPNGCVWREK